MANTDNRFGLKVVKTGGNCAIAGKYTAYYVPSTYATALYIGDPVVMTGTSNVAAAGAGKEFAPGTLREINKATAGDTNVVTGAIVGFQPLPGSETLTYNTASTARVVYVDDDPSTIFEIQSDSANATAATDMGANANLVYTHAGDTTTGLSGAELNTASMTTTNTFQLRILGLSPRVKNELGTHSKLLVRINNHTEAPNKAGI